MRSTIMASELLHHLGFYPLPKHLTFREVLRGSLFSILLLAYLVVYHAIALSMYGVRLWSPTSFEFLKRDAASLFWRLCLYILERNGVQIQVTGDGLEAGCALVISNHRSLVDYIVLAHLSRLSVTEEFQLTSDKEMRGIISPRSNFFTWFKVWSIPSPRVMFNMLTCDENWELDEEANVHAFSEAANSKASEWIILFPEVNIYTQESSKIQKEMSDKYYLPKLDHLLYPRFSSFYNAAVALSNTFFSRLYDVTILYYENAEQVESSIEPIPIADSSVPRRLLGKRKGDIDRLSALRAEPLSCNASLLSESSAAISSAAKNPPVFSALGEFKNPSLLELLSVQDSKYVIRVHVKSKLLGRVPTKRRKLEKWLESHWCEKDKLMEAMILSASRSN